MKNHTDFSQGSVAGNILRMAGPMILAQLVSVLYSIVDRMYIGHIPGASANALTGVGVTFPVLLMINAFANLFGTGGVSLFSMARGRGDTKRAQKLMGNSCAMLLITCAIISAAAGVFMRPVLYAFGASDATYPYAQAYLSVYLLGTIFVMLGLGMNGFINAQGFALRGMGTVVLGAVVNIALDPIFIFWLDMGVRGAAIATVIAQAASAIWAMRFLTGSKSLIRLTLRALRIRWKLVGEIVKLGFSGFIMGFTNSAVQTVCNATLQAFGGDVYVGVMTVISSVREIASAPINGFTSAAQPVMGFNYGAKKYARVRQGIFFTTAFGLGAMGLIWLAIMLFPNAFCRPFCSDEALLTACVPSMRIYFFGFYMMALQMAGQATAVALGRAKQAVFFSLLRKAFIVVPLTLVLPHIAGLGVNGVFAAEPISNFIGGTACYVTMLLTIGREMKRGALAEKAPDPRREAKAGV